MFRVTLNESQVFTMPSLQTNRSYLNKLVVGAISIHLLVSFILVLLILATWGSIALGVARHGKLGISTGWITQLGKGVDGGEHTVLTVALKPTSPTASC